MVQNPAGINSNGARRSKLWPKTILGATLDFWRPFGTFWGTFGVPLGYLFGTFWVPFGALYALKGCMPSEDLYALKGLVCPQGTCVPSRDLYALKGLEGFGPHGPTI